MGNPGYVRWGSGVVCDERTLFGLIAVEVAVGDGPRSFQGRDDCDADDGLVLGQRIEIGKRRIWTNGPGLPAERS